MTNLSHGDVTIQSLFAVLVEKSCKMQCGTTKKITKLTFLACVIFDVFVSVDFQLSTTEMNVREAVRKSLETCIQELFPGLLIY